MKKTYLNPITESINIQHVTLLAGSGTLKGEGVEMTITDTGAGYDAEGRSFDFDED